MKNSFSFLLAMAIACCLLSPVSAMTQSHDDPADLAAAELLTLLEGHHAAGDFDETLAGLNAATGKSLAHDDLLFVVRDVPLTYLGEIVNQINVSFLPGAEGDRRRTGAEIEESFTVDVAVELKMNTANSDGNAWMRKLSRHISDIVHFADATSAERQRRHLASVDAMCINEDIVRSDPAELARTSVFVSLRKFAFESIN